MAQIAGLFLDEQLVGDIGGVTLPRILKALPYKPLKAAGFVLLSSACCSKPTNSF